MSVPGASPALMLALIMHQAGKDARVPKAA